MTTPCQSASARDDDDDDDGQPVWSSGIVRRGFSKDEVIHREVIQGTYLAGQQGLLGAGVDEPALPVGESDSEGEPDPDLTHFTMM